MIQHTFCVCCVSVCVCAFVLMHLCPCMTRAEASRQKGLGIVYSETGESSPQDSINQSRLISFVTALSVAEVANYSTQKLHRDLLYSPYDVCAFCQLYFINHFQLVLTENGLNLKKKKKMK